MIHGSTPLLKRQLEVSQASFRDSLVKKTHMCHLHLKVKTILSCFPQIGRNDHDGKQEENELSDRREWE